MPGNRLAKKLILNIMKKNGIDADGPIYRSQVRQIGPTKKYR